MTKVKEVHPKELFENGVVKEYTDNIQAIEEFIKLVDELKIDKNASIEDKIKAQQYVIQKYESKDRLKVLKGMLQLKKDEFYGKYLPNFEKQLEVCNKEFEKHYEKAKSILHYVKPNYFTEGVSNYPMRNPGNADLRLRVAFFKFLTDELPAMERLAKKHPNYRD